MIQVQSSVRITVFNDFSMEENQILKFKSQSDLKCKRLLWLSMNNLHQSMNAFRIEYFGFSSVYRLQTWKKPVILSDQDRPILHLH